MLQLNQCKLPIDHTETELEEKIRRLLRLDRKTALSYEIRRRSIDARRKPELYYVYQLWVQVADEQKVLRRCPKTSVQVAKTIEYDPHALAAQTPQRKEKEPSAAQLPRRKEKEPSAAQLPQRKEEKSSAAQLPRRKEKESSAAQLPRRKETPPPVIIGAGPAGLFCAYLLTELGLPPVVCERGRRVDRRRRDVERFWETGILDPSSNVQFGEGGAGTFSDGKLNTSVKDSSGRNRFVLETFVKFGAPSDILYEQKPHIGTDILSKVIADMRRYMEERGCVFRFETLADDFIIEEGRLRAVILRSAGGEKKRLSTDAVALLADTVVLACGHSARDTFERLYALNIPMEAKNFAVGFRVEHPQRMIDEAMYGNQSKSQSRIRLPAAPYKVTCNFPNGRGVYSFCMCPGGYVVQAASGPDQAVVNGMSYSGRAGNNANSAIIVSVSPEDFGGADALAGIRFQMELEKKAWELGNGRIPQQLYGDYQANRMTTSYGEFGSETKGAKVFANLRGLFTPDVEQSFLGGMEQFARSIPDFDRADAILSGVESRTSSPVRILRGESLESSVGGLYPCGEGAGYAGGITSAAVDGLRVAEAVARGKGMIT